jgi:hypothetical protein
MMTFIQAKLFPSRGIKKMVMKSHRLILIGFASLSGLLLAGCASTDYDNTISNNSIPQF